MSAWCGEWRVNGESKQVEGDNFNQVLSRLCELFSPTPEQREKLAKYGYVNLGDGASSAGISFDHTHYTPRFDDKSGEWIAVPVPNESHE